MKNHQSLLTFNQSLYSEMHATLQNFTITLDSEVSNIEKCIEAVKSCLIRLNEFIKLYEFKDKRKRFITLKM